MTIQVHDHDLTLLPEKALLFDANLVLGDTHFGKSAAFRARGIPIPEGDTARDAARITALVDRHEPERLIIAGDFLHTATGRSPIVLETLAATLKTLPCQVHLVLGNHDQRAGNLPADWSVMVHSHWSQPPIHIVHDPADAPTIPGRLSLCGHLHPVVLLKDGKNSYLRTPCFWLQSDKLILPSFGTFTGGAVIDPTPGDRIFAPVGTRVIEVPPGAL